MKGKTILRLPNTLSLSLQDIDANILLSEIKEYVAASAGAVILNLPAGLESTVLSGNSVDPEERRYR